MNNRVVVAAALVVYRIKKFVIKRWNGPADENGVFVVLYQRLWWNLVWSDLMCGMKTWPCI